ncbi:MAG: TIR domain-containing protein [Chloroflexi bacterium]|nr:TIR domain-containing protein [Chloroflexota bacterium]
MSTSSESSISIPFAAYKGNKPYLFISYSHKDSALVYSIISRFNDQGYPVWYDEGIEPGIEWPEEIAHALNNCSLFVVFISPNSVLSENVRNEINFALAKRSPFIAIHLSVTNLTPGLQLQIGSKQGILKYQLDEDTFTRKYQYSFNSVLSTEQKITPPPSPPDETKNTSVTPQQPAQSAPLPQLKPSSGTIQFKCDAIRRAACISIGFPEDRPLEEKHTHAITELKFFGNSYGEENLTTQTFKDHIIIYKKNGPLVSIWDRGSITDLTDFSHFVNLKRLCIQFQQFRDLSPLSNLPLKTLDLSCNELEDLEPISHLKQLTNLTMDFATYQVLKPLENLPELVVLSMIGISYPSFQQLCTLSLDKLRYLKIAESKLESLDGISRFQAIDFLEIQSSSIFEFEDLVNLKNLKFLLMMGTKCTDYSFLKKISNLQSLSVDEDQKTAIIEMFGEKPEFLK